MNVNKLVLLIIAVVAIGIFALPSTVSLFSGQHTWYALGDPGNQLPCEKCHSDIEDEMGGVNGVHTTLGCKCHRVSDTIRVTGVADGDGVDSTPGTTSHAAETIACMICHEEGNQLAGYPHAGGFNQTAVYVDTGVDPSDEYNYSDALGAGGEHAAHNAFINLAINDTLMEDSNEACIACHTRIGVNITWKKNEYLEFSAGEDALGNWTVEEFVAGGTNVTTANSPNEWTNP